MNIGTINIKEDLINEQSGKEEYNNNNAGVIVCNITF
jgi:hypothetical protein